VAANPPLARTNFAEARQSRQALQADDGERQASSSSPIVAAGPQSCVACVVFIGRVGSSIAGRAGQPRKKQ